MPLPATPTTPPGIIIPATAKQASAFLAPRAAIFTLTTELNKTNTSGTSHWFAKQCGFNDLEDKYNGAEMKVNRDGRELPLRFYVREQSYLQLGIFKGRNFKKRNYSLSSGFGAEANGFLPTQLQSARGDCRIFGEVSIRGLVARASIGKIHAEFGVKLSTKACFSTSAAHTGFDNSAGATLSFR